MTGHGHVTPNADGSKARCGGPSICSQCAKEAAAKDAQGKPPLELVEMLEVALSATMQAYSVANRTPPYHSYMPRLQEVIRELIDMKRMA